MSTRRFRLNVRRIAAATMLLAVSLALPRTAYTTPSYARRYDTACATCHAPLPPRLNNVGMLFRRAGFRMPDADENGNLVLKAIPAHGITDAVSLSAEFVARREPAPEPGTNRGTMGIDEVELVAGTAIDDHVSAQLMFLPQNGEGKAELEDIEAQVNFGLPSRQFVVRAGKMQTLLWQKGNHGSITPSLPLVLDEEPTGPVGGFGGLALGVKQVGVEAGYTFTQLKKGKVLATLVSAAVLNGVTGSGEAASRDPTGGVDVLLQAYELFGSRNTAGAFYYSGRTLIDAEGALVPPGPFRERFKRGGFLTSISPVEWLELAGSGVIGTDRSGELGRDVRTRGGYLEATGSIRPHWTATYRWEQLDPDTDTGGDLLRANVLATSCQVWDSVLLSAEYRQVRQGESKPHGILGVVRLVF